MDCYFVTKEGKLGEGKYVSGYTSDKINLSVVELTIRKHSDFGELCNVYYSYEYNLIDRFTGEILATITSDEKIGFAPDSMLSLKNKSKFGNNIDKIVSDAILDTNINKEFRNIAHEYFQSLMRQSIQKLLNKRSETR